ncbi:hypothetical protein F0562_011445 [Nyssa sinensis]|uniref:Uncharacterized protein n=1 Tax=Nyssa sinensis TaxID=561372 RepID=A0A5J5A6E3_9ASTE|nr:hypothetical protein F0562_011445 [Nyssa sinensis]
MPNILVFARVDGCCDVGKEKAGENDQEKKDDGKDKKKINNTSQRSKGEGSGIASKDRHSIYQNGTTKPSYFSSSIYYGGQEMYSPTGQTTGSQQIEIGCIKVGLGIPMRKSSLVKMTRTLEVLAAGAGGMGDESVSHLSIGILLLCQLLMAMSIISLIVFACADGICCDAGKEKQPGENDQEKKDDSKEKRTTNEVTITCCGDGVCCDGEGSGGGGSGCGGGCGGD